MLASGLTVAAVAETLTDIAAAHIGVEIAKEALDTAETDIEADHVNDEFLLCFFCHLDSGGYSSYKTAYACFSVYYLIYTTVCTLGIMFQSQFTLFAHSKGSDRFMYRIHCS